MLLDLLRINEEVAHVQEDLRMARRHHVSSDSASERRKVSEEIEDLEGTLQELVGTKDL